MNNTVLIENKIRQKLKLICALMCVISLFFITALVCVFLVGRQTLNGQTNEVSGVLSEIYTEEGDNTVTIDKDKHYNVVWNDADNGIDLNDYIDKTVTLIVTRDTFASNPWALGLVINGETVVDYKITLDIQTAANNNLKIIFSAVAAVLCAATCGLFIWRFNLQPVKERELYKEFGEFLSQRQPTCKERKILLIYVAVYIGILIALLLTAVLIDPNADTISELCSAAKGVLWALLAVCIAGLAGALALNRWIARKEIDFYAEKLPFDFSDISHTLMRKKLKEQLQQEILKDYADHPDTYADGGNGYDVTFEKGGVSLTLPFDEEETQQIQNTPMPSANEVFGEMNQNDSRETSDNLIVTNKSRLQLSYEELNLEAVAYFRKNCCRPMVIIVKSRIEKTDKLPEEFTNDIHIPFDINLFNTLNKYDVKVEGLEYLLENKKQLMIDNCLNFRKNKRKIEKNNEQ